MIFTQNNKQAIVILLSVEDTQIHMELGACYLLKL